MYTYSTQFNCILGGALHDHCILNVGGLHRTASYNAQYSIYRGTVWLTNSHCLHLVKANSEIAINVYCQSLNLLLTTVTERTVR